MEKLEFKGMIKSIQPRIRLTRSFDESSHSYLGYAIAVHGWIGQLVQEDNSNSDMIDTIKTVFSVGIGKAAQAKHQFRVGDGIMGACLPVQDERLEPVEYYKVSKLLKTYELPEGGQSTPPPWETIPVELEEYRARGRRRLASRTYDTKCSSCVWGCRMPVEIIIDQWNPSKMKYRSETFCYGPLSCSNYKAGPKRQVEGRKGMVYIEEDWVDEELTSHREWDE